MSYIALLPQTPLHIKFKIFCLHRFIENVYNHTSDAKIVVRAYKKTEQILCSWDGF